MILGFLPLSKGSRACRKSATACGSLSGDEDSRRSYPLATRCVTRLIDVTGYIRQVFDACCMCEVWSLCSGCRWVGSIGATIALEVVMAMIVYALVRRWCEHHCLDRRVTQRVSCLRAGSSADGCGARSRRAVPVRVADECKVPSRSDSGGENTRKARETEARGIRKQL